MIDNRRIARKKLGTCEEDKRVREVGMQKYKMLTSPPPPYTSCNAADWQLSYLILEHVGT